MTHDLTNSRELLEGSPTEQPRATFLLNLRERGHLTFIVIYFQEREGLFKYTFFEL